LIEKIPQKSKHFVRASVQIWHHMTWKIWSDVSKQSVDVDISKVKM